MKKNIAAPLMSFALALSACSPLDQSTPAPAPQLTVAPAPPFTQVPTNSPLPSPETPTTSSEWSGFPIMPGATAGDGDDESYVFTIQATARQVQEYYKTELGRLGWQALVQGEGSNALTLLFTKDSSATLTVRIITKGNESLVLLVK